MNFSQVVVLVLLLTATLRASAFPKFRDEIPNGKASDSQGSGITCAHLGHNDCKAGAPRNQFGLDFKSSKFKWTKELCEKDSDGDGLTNGQELGDPCCRWKKGQKPDRTTQLSHPGEKSEDGAKSAKKCATRPAPPTKNPSDSQPDSAPNSPQGAAGSPKATEAASNDVCFPADVTVEREDGTLVRMDMLSLGERVRVGPRANDFSAIFMFTHRTPNVLVRFVRLRTEHGREVRLTHLHMIYADNMLVPAEKVRIGMKLQVGNSLERVTQVDCVTGEGLYNPQTVHGDIVVNGITISTYTQSFQYKAAHSVLAPLRALYAHVGIYITAFDDGVPLAGVRQTLRRTFGSKST